MADKKIVIADDDADFLTALTQRCKTLGLAVQTATDGDRALAAVMQDEPDLLILDVNMPAGGGLDVAEKLLNDPKLRPLPVIFCTGGSDPATIDRCKTLGAHYVTKGADVWSNLKPIICRLMATQQEATAVASTAPAAAAAPAPPQAPRPKVLVVDDDPDLRRVMQIRLRACGLDVHLASTAMQALWIAMKEMPDVIITDYNMPEGSGQYLIGRLKGTAMLKDIPVILLTGESRDFALERRFKGEYGASAFLSKPVELDVLLSALAEHIEIDSEVRRTASKLRRR